MTQALEALAFANEVRFGLARLKAELEQLREDDRSPGTGSGHHWHARRRLAQVILNPDDIQRRWQVDATLKACPGIGPDRIRQARAAVGVPRNTRLRQLSVRQRIALAGWLEGGGQ